MSEDNENISECAWTLEQDDTGTWLTSCRQEFIIVEGTPEQNRMLFCCYCGKPLKKWKVI